MSPPEQQYRENVQRQVGWDAWHPTWNAEIYTYGVRITWRVGDETWACAKLLPVSRGIVDGTTETFHEVIAGRLVSLAQRAFPPVGMGEDDLVTMDWFLIDEHPGHPSGREIPLLYPRFV